MSAPAQKSQGMGFGELFGRLKKSPLGMVGLTIVIALALCAIFADSIAPYTYSKQDLMNTFSPPSEEHFFGTDEFGRDVFSRVVYGARISLIVGFISVSIALVCGGFLGAIAAYYGGVLENVIMRCMDVMLSIPQILLAIAIAASLGPGLFNLMIAVGLSSTPGYARIVRGSVLSIKGQEFIEAAKALGSKDLRIILRHILPNCMAPVIVQATLGVGSAILNAAGLSFIGLGIKPPVPEWGAMLAGGRGYIRDYPFVAVFPGLAIMISILALNFLGDGLRDALDPKLKR